MEHLTSDVGWYKCSVCHALDRQPGKFTDYGGSVGTNRTQIGKLMLRISRNHFRPVITFQALGMAGYAGLDLFFNWITRMI